MRPFVVSHCPRHLEVAPFAPTLYAACSAFEDDPASRKWNLWSYIDARHGAQAVVRALAHERPGFDIFNMANPHAVMSRPSADLMAEFLPDVEFQSPLKVLKPSDRSIRPARPQLAAVTHLA